MEKNKYQEIPSREQKKERNLPEESQHKNESGTI